jgi:hypothetical protein
MDVVIRRSRRKGKKYDAVFPDGKTVAFGAVGYEDYTIHGDPKRKANYLARHSGDPKNIYTPGGLARDLLWSKPSLSEAATFASKKHGVRIKLDSHLR